LFRSEEPEIVAVGSQGPYPITVTITPTTDCVIAPIQTNGAETKYEFAYSESESGPWTPFTTGASGVVSAAEDFAIPGREACVTSLTPETTYYARFKAANEQGAVEEIQSF